MNSTLIELHTKGADQTRANDSPLFAAWTASYINEGGDVVRDLRADIAAEGGARQTYESLVKMAPDNGSKQTLAHLLTREGSGISRQAD